jgi:hypothetical protein
VSRQWGNGMGAFAPSPPPRRKDSEMPKPEDEKDIYETREAAKALGMTMAAEEYRKPTGLFPEEYWVLRDGEGSRMYRARTTYQIQIWLDGYAHCWDYNGVGLPA